MRSILWLPVEIATAFFFSASIAICSGVVAISFTHRAGDGLKVALVAFLAAAASFGYSIWRNYHPRPMFRTPPRRARGSLASVQ